MASIRERSTQLILGCFPFRWQAAIILLLLIDFICYQAFTLSSISIDIRMQDKVLHASAFAVLFVLGHISLSYDFFPGEPRFRPKIILINWVGLLSYGLFIEAVQDTLAHRQASLGDFIADTVGIALGNLLVVLLKIYPRAD